MKNMAILVDTNIVLDWILKRQQFHQAATQVIEYCIRGEVKGYLAAHSILNVFFITRKDFSTIERQQLSKLRCSKFTIIGITHEMLLDVLNHKDFKDIEDGLQMECAANAKLDYIITRDTSGFQTSKVPALLPQAFLEMLAQSNHSH